MQLADEGLEWAALRSYALVPAFREGVESISVDAFTSVDRICAWRALEGAAKPGQRIGPTALAAAIAAAGMGPADAKCVARQVCDPRDLVLASEAVRLAELAQLRHAVRAAELVLAAAATGDLASVSAAASDLGRSAAQVGRRGTAFTAHEIAQQALGAVFNPGSAPLDVDPGLECLRRIIGPLPLGSLHVIGADTNVGKSGVLLAMLAGLASSGQPCGYVSCEDGRSIVGTRLVSAVSGVSSRAMLRRQVSREDYVAIDRGVIELAKWPLHIELLDGVANRDDLTVCAAISRLADKGCKLVAVDYVQAISASGKAQDRRNEIRLIAERLKARAARAQVALVLASQLSRPPKESPNREPSKHSLKESGDLENAAETVILAWREEDSDAVPVRFRLAKSKWGGVGSTWVMRRDASGFLREE